MLIGEYPHSIDDKGRLSFPAKLREDLGESFVLTRGLDGCIAAYSSEEWQRIHDKFASLPSAKARNLKRFMFASAASVVADKQGRVLLPQILRDFAGLDRDVYIIGASDHAEVWDEEKWCNMRDAMSYDSIAEAMDELGF